MKNSFLQKRQFFNSFILYLTLSMFFLFFCYVVVYFVSFVDRGTSSNAYHQINRISKDVIVKSSDSTEKKVDLPAKFSSGHTYSYRFFAKKLEEEEALYIFIKGEYLKFRLRCGEEKIYEFQPVDTALMKSGANFLRFIKVPEKYKNKELTIEFAPLFKSSYGIRIPEIILGSHSDLLMFHYFNEFDIFVTSMFLFVFGVESILVMIFAFFFKKLRVRFFMISVFAFVSGIYIFVGFPLVFMSIPKGAFLNTIEYITFMYIPIFLVIFVLNVFKEEEKTSWQYLLGRRLSQILMINLFLQMVLTFTKMSEFMKMQKITQVLFIVSFIYIFTLKFTLKAKGKKEQLFLVVALLLGIICTSLIVIYMYTSQIKSMIFVGVAILIFIIYQVYFEIRVFTARYKEFYMVKLYKGLALIDNLTRLANRNAFERDFKNNKSLIGKEVLLMMLDINNLKNINDTYGHHIGDLLIQSMAESIRDSLKEYDNFKAYRIGGDEFVIVAINVDDSHAKELKVYIEKVANKISLKNAGISLAFGMGYGVYKIDEETDVTELIYKVDKKMYKDKKEKKDEVL